MAGAPLVPAITAPLPAENTPAAPEILPLRPVDLSTAAAVWPQLTRPEDPAAFIRAINYSLDYLASPKAVTDYDHYPIPAVTRNRVWESLRQLRTLVQQTSDDQSWQQALAQHFELYAAAGHDGEGTVHFTGYFEPVYTASRIPTADYRYPLYRKPPDLDSWSSPQPTRLDLEGVDGLQGEQGPLANLELVWLQDRLEAFLIQVQGSAKLQLTDDTTMSVGYAGRTDYPYTSIGRLLVTDGKLAADQLSLPNLIQYFQTHPEDLDRYLPQNQRFVFFRETAGGNPTGTLSVPVTPGISIATDKTLLPPGAPALMALPLPELLPDGQWTVRDTNRLVLDQDTGGAIIGPGRVDLFTGTGAVAGELAGRINTNGQLYYLLVPEPAAPR